jgi:hypothetical protein
MQFHRTEPEMNHVTALFEIIHPTEDWRIGISVQNCTLNLNISEEVIQRFIGHSGDQKGIVWKNFRTDVGRTIFL